MYHANLRSEKVVCIAPKSARIERPRGSREGLLQAHLGLADARVWAACHAKADVVIAVMGTQRYDPPLVPLARDANFRLFRSAALGFDAARRMAAARCRTDL